MELMDIVKWVSFAVYPICLPLAITCFNAIYQHREEIYVQKRNFGVVIGWNLALIFQIIACCICQLTVVTFNDLGRILSFSAYYMCWWILLYFLITKNWILFYKSKWTE
eukprot:300555_1